MTKRLLLTILFFLISFPCFAWGIGDWLNKTPKGNIMFDSGGGTVLTLTKNQTEFADINNWYFYRGHIIGQTDSSYFIINEVSAEIRLFQSKPEWESHIRTSDLKPVFWTRCFSDNWRFFEQIAFLLLVLVVLLSIPFLAFLVWSIQKWLSGKKRFHLKKRDLLVLFGFVFLVMIRIMLDTYPQSW
jgi:uncharacterized protein YdeI (BOF family)